MSEYRYEYGNSVAIVIAGCYTDAVKKVRKNIGRRFVVKIIKVKPISI